MADPIVRVIYAGGWVVDLKNSPFFAEQMMARNSLADNGDSLIPSAIMRGQSYFPVTTESYRN